MCYDLLATLDENGLHAKYGPMIVSYFLPICRLAHINQYIAVSCGYATYFPTHAWAANNFGNETKGAVGMGLYTADEAPPFRQP